MHAAVLLCRICFSQGIGTTKMKTGGGGDTAGTSAGLPGDAAAAKRRKSDPPGEETLRLTGAQQRKATVTARWGAFRRLHNFEDGCRLERDAVSDVLCTRRSVRVVPEVMVVLGPACR